MNPGIEIVKELEELASPLALMPRTTPFAVPEGYFTTLTYRVTELSQYSEEQVPHLPVAMPYALPEGYFEGFAATLMDKVAEVPDFGSIEPAKFEVPAGYFEVLPQQILAAVKAADTQASDAPKIKQPRVIGFFPQKAARWAAAAGLILAVGFGGYQIFNQPQPISAERQLAQLDKSVISSYVQQHLDEFDTEMLAEGSPVLTQSPEKNINKLNEAAIQNYLDTEGI